MGADGTGHGFLRVGRPSGSETRCNVRSVGAVRQPLCCRRAWRARAVSPASVCRSAAAADTVSARYLRDTLGYESDLFYIGPFGGAWPPPERFRGDWMSVPWTFRPGPEAPLLDAMAANLGLRVLHASGLYDLVTPPGPPAYQIRQLAPELRARFAVRVYEGGHSFYLDRTSRMRFKEDGAALIRAAVQAASGR